MPKIIWVYFIALLICIFMFLYGVASIVVEINEVGLKNIIEDIWEGKQQKEVK